MQSSISQQKSQKNYPPKVANLSTIVRLRPLLPHETDVKQAIFVKDEKTIEIHTIGTKRIQKLQSVFSHQTTQRQLFDYVQPFLAKSMEGYNVTIFTYGQTGSGKTYTMFGSDWNNILKSKSEPKPTPQNKQNQTTFLRSIEQDENHSGIIPRTIHLLFDKLVVPRRKHIKVYCSFLQLYNQNMYDLFQQDQKILKQQKLLIHQNKQDGIYVQGLNQMEVKDVDECLQLMQKGQKNRIVRQTHMNIKSSRSHTLFQLLVEEVFPAKKSYRRMKINLCDLAGSQKIIKTARMQTDHFEQLKNINLSLTTLGKVISTLSNKDHQKPVYRESKLTRLLQDSLGGNTYTALIATITSKSNCLDESMNTLKFLERAQQIKTQIRTNVFSDNPEMKNLEKQITYLKDILRMKRNGANMFDLDNTDKLKKLQNQNQKLKELVDKDLVERLKRQNLTLKKELERKSNDFLSQSYLQSKDNFNNYKTIENDKRKEKQQQEEVKSDVQKRGETTAFRSIKKVGSTKKTYDGLSTNKDTLKRDTGISLFPSISQKGTKKQTTILDRIMLIQKAKQDNKNKLEKKLDMLESKNTFQLLRSNNRNSKYTNKYK